MTTTKEYGGLGIRSMRNMNIAFVAKLGWLLITAKNELWASILQTKYVRGKVEIDKLKRKQRTSNAWHGIVAGSDVIRKGIKARVLNGN